LACLLDNDLTTVTSLHTTFKVLAEMHPSWNDAPEARSLKALEAEVLRRSGTYHANSRAILETIQQDPSLEIDTKTIALIPHGLTDHAANTRRRRDDRRVRVLFVGRLEKRKGIDLLLEATPLLCARHAELEFQIVGDNTIPAESGITYEAEFRARVGSALEDRVLFTGPLPDDALREAYADADVFCAPSRYESFGLVLVEAMMFSVPVVCTQVGGMPEVASPDCGLLVAPEDVGALIAALDRLVADPDLRRNLGRRARERFVEHFTREAMVAKVEKFYHAVASDAPVPISLRRAV
jgi:glycogen synthase